MAVKSAFFVVLVFLPVACAAQTRETSQAGPPRNPSREAVDRLPAAPAPKWPVITSNAVNFASTFFTAASVHAGAHDCVVREELQNRDPAGEYRRAVLVGSAIDMGLLIATWKLRKKHPGLATWLPAASAGVKFGVGASQYSSGCS